MKHIVKIWGANFSSEEELHAYVEAVYDNDGEAQPSAFLAELGYRYIDKDFLEAHFFNNEEERIAFIQYLKIDYSPHGSFGKQLPAAIDEYMRAYHSIILLYGNDSLYGAINDELFQSDQSDSLPSSLICLIASIEYESQ
ncbi:immunity 22 family protein [Paenibacillus sp. GCM10027627]|uniref:immunity 22 family protein n=1 Tax=unclassified Paenibacillus TaxID=185978 RepID=UPI003630AA24